MTAPIHSPSHYTDFNGLKQLKTDAREDSQAALRTVAEQFESIFLGMMLKSMRDASIGDQLFDSNAQNTYMEMYDKELTTSLATKGGIGLADTIVRQLSQHVPNSGEAASELSKIPFNPADYVVSTPSKVEKQAQPQSPQRFESPEQFIEALWPMAKQAAKELGVDPKVLLSQAALETGWGSRVVRRVDGESSYNLFNIKADNRWLGDRAVVSTLEYRQGIPQQEKAAFRAYDSYEQSFSDYVAFIKGSARYREALANAGDGAGYVEGLQRGGYATDPEYANKIKDIMGRELFIGNDV